MRAFVQSDRVWSLCGDREAGRGGRTDDSGDGAVSVNTRQAMTGMRVRQARLAALMTLEELAEKSGVSARAISDLERGRTRSAYPRTLRLLADALGLSWSADGELVPPDGAADQHDLPDVPAPADDATPLTPGQLPAGPRHFTGRTAELAKLTEWLNEGDDSASSPAISAVCGTAGVGKTALATHWAHRVAGQFPDGQLHVNLGGFGPSGEFVTPARAIRRFLDGLGVAPERVPADLEAQAALYRSLLARKRMLIVLDNARDAAQVRPLLPGGSGCVVLVTSRIELTGLAAADGAHLLTLDVLNEEDARELLGSRLGEARITDAGDTATAELATLCARLPLALSIAAARAAARPGLGLAALVAELRDAKTRLDGLATGDSATDVRTVFSWSWRQLSKPAARMFLLLGAHPGPDVAAPAAASLAGLSPGRARQALAELTRAHLLTEQAPGRYTCHDLLRVYAAEQALSYYSDAARRTALHRLLDHYVHTAYRASQLFDPEGSPFQLDPPMPQVRPEPLDDRQQALRWYQAERHALVGAINLAAAQGFSTHSWQLPRSAATFFRWHGHWEELAASEQHALMALCQLGDRAAQIPPHRLLALAKRRLGDASGANAHLIEALELAQQLGDCVRQARVHTDLAEVLDLEGRSHEAIAHDEESLRLCQAAGYRLGEAMALNNLGWHHARGGSYQEALTYCQQALGLLRELGDRRGAPGTLHSLGYAHHHLGQHREAIAYYQQAIRHHGQGGSQHERATFLSHLGDAQEAAGDVEAAQLAWQQALVILDDLHDPAADQLRSRLCPQRLPLRLAARARAAL
jgi:tetratricopeptide (TPR) repeat protein/transcriptional regulator with XRE-family HTH domain